MSISNPVSKTALWIAAARAVETRRPDRLFDDPFAEALAGHEGIEMLRTMASAGRPPGTPVPLENPYLVIRTRFIDDLVAATLATGVIRQIVLLAAGLDARAYRIPCPPGTRCYELDRQEVLEFKDRTLKRLGARPLCDRTAIAADLAAGFREPLLASGFQAAQPSLWIVEGLLPYLDAAQSRGVLLECASLAAPASVLVSDVAGLSLLQCAWLQPFMQALDSIHAPWKFGTDDPETFFGAAGWNATVRRPGEDGASFGRWPFPVPPRNTPGVPQSYFVTAVRA